MNTMLCNCDQEGHQESELLRLEVQQRLGVLKPEDLTQTVLLSLAWELGVEPVVYADQWFAVSTGTNSVECDSPIDGLVYIWKLLADKYPDKIPSRSINNQQTRDLSRAQLDARSSTERAYNKHKETCTECDLVSRWKPCPEGRRLWDLMIDARDEIDVKWGLPHYDFSPSFWGNIQG